MATPGEEEAYGRGFGAGEIDARLAGHDEHLSKINGNIVDLTASVRDLVLATQRLADRAEAAAKTVVTTAAALKDAEEARRMQSERSWSPLTRVSVMLGVVATLLTIYLALRQ